MNTTKITSLSHYYPQRIVSNIELAKLISDNNFHVNPEIFKEKFGIEERRFARVDEQASDLAVSAALKIITPQNKDTIDCIIFAAGSSDMIEPATSSIIQSKLKINCPTFDIKNACNSFVCGLQTANALILSNTYKKILLLSGEKLSSIIKFSYTNNLEFIKRFASLSMGDAGAASIIEKTDDDSGMYAQQFQTNGEYWDLCTVPGGGSLHAQDGSKIYFEGRTSEMKKVFFDKKGELINKTLLNTGWHINDLDHVFMHHVSTNTFKEVAQDLCIPFEKFYNVFEKFGNMAACSIPFSMSIALQEGKLKKGDKIMLLGLASGISISVQLIIW